MSSSMSQMDVFERIINRKTYAIIVSTDVQDAIEKYLTSITNYWNGQLNTISGEYATEAAKPNPDPNKLQSLSIQFNQAQTEMQGALTMTNSTSQKATSFSSTLNSDLQSTLTSTSYLTMMMQYLNGLLKTAP